MTLKFHKLIAYKSSSSDFIIYDDKGYKSRFAYCVKEYNTETKQNEDIWVNCFISWGNSCFRDILLKAQQDGNIVQVAIITNKIPQASLHEGKKSYALSLSCYDIALKEFTTKEQYEKFNSNNQYKNNLGTRETKQEDDSFNPF